MPLMEDDPPMVLPRDTSTNRLLIFGSGSDQKPQLKRGMFIGIDNAVGI